MQLSDARPTSKSAQSSSCPLAALELTAVQPKDWVVNTRELK